MESKKPSDDLERDKRVTAKMVACKNVSVWLVNGNTMLPEQANGSDVGYDVRLPKQLVMRVGEVKIVPLDIIVQPEHGYHFEVYLRSSTPRKHGLLIPNGVGIIDPTYCGENDIVGLQLYKFGPGGMDDINGMTKIAKGTRIAQLVLRKTEHVRWGVSGDNENDDRGGFGSTDA